ncbi:MAG: hypothetical protein H7841_14235, partial [Magnetospirillum sp. WYHS-4]
MYPEYPRIDENEDAGGLGGGLYAGLAPRRGPFDLGDDEDDETFFKKNREDSFFSLDGPVGPGRRNDPRDVIKVQSLLGNGDLGSFGRYQGP